jgi:hypothetical protein
MCFYSKQSLMQDSVHIFSLKVAILLWVFVFGPSYPSNGQSRGANAQMEAMRHAGQLKKGILFVRLQSNRNKLNKLDELAKSDPQRSERWRKAYVETAAQTRAAHLLLAEAISENYHFSKVAYIYDFQVPDLRGMSTVEAIIDMNSGASQTIDLQSTNWYLLTDDPTLGEGPEMYRLLDKNLRILESPFPARFRKNSVWNVMIGAFNPKIDRHRNKAKLFQKWNLRLMKLYPFSE